MRAVGTHKSGRKDVIISTVEASPFLRRALKNEEATNGTVSAAVSLIGAPLVKRLGFTTTIGASRKTCQSVHNTCKHNAMPAAGMSSLNGSEDIRSGHSEHIRRVSRTSPLENVIGPTSVRQVSQHANSPPLHIKAAGIYTCAEDGSKRYWCVARRTGRLAGPAPTTLARPSSADPHSLRAGTFVLLCGTNTSKVSESRTRSDPVPRREVCMA